MEFIFSFILSGCELLHLSFQVKLLFIKFLRVKKKKKAAEMDPMILQNKRKKESNAIEWAGIQKGQTWERSRN